MPSRRRDPRDEPDVTLTVREATTIAGLLAWFIVDRGNGTLFNDPSRIGQENVIREKFGLRPLSAEEELAIIRNEMGERATPMGDVRRWERLFKVARRTKDRCLKSD